MGFLDIFKRKPSYEELKEKAQALEVEKDFLGAAEVWKRIVKFTPDPVATYINVAENLSQSGNKEQALEWFYKAVHITSENSPNCSEIDRKYGVALMECGRYDDAEIQLVIAQKVDPDNWNVHFNWGELHEKLNEKDLAVDHYRKVYDNASPKSSIWQQSRKKIEQLSGKVPGTANEPGTFRTDAVSETPISATQNQDEDPVVATTNSILALPDEAFFLYVSRILQRTVGQNALKSLGGNGPSETVTSIIESLSREFEEYAGISTVQKLNEPMEDFNDQINRSDSFELNILTQWYNARTGIVKIQTADADDSDQVREAKLQILKACEMILVASAETFGWHYVPSAIQSAWDLDTLTLLQGQSKLKVVLQLGYDPFVHVDSDKKGLDRLKYIPSIDLISTVQKEVTRFEKGKVDAQTDLGKETTQEGVAIDVPLQSGNAYVDDCFIIGFRDIPDTRNWYEIEEIRKAQPLQWSGDTDLALKQMRNLVSTYNDFDILYGWMSQVYRRMGDPTGAMDVLMTGLRNANLKAGLCSDIGTMYFEDLKDLRKAVMWWIRSCVIQMGGGTADLAFSFLNLSAVANPFPSLDTERQWLLDQADRIDPGRTRFNEQGLNERHQMAMDQGNESMITAIKRLYQYYSGEARSADGLASQHSVTLAGDMPSSDVSLYIFDYDKMESSYGHQAFTIIKQALYESKGVCTFSHGDLEVSVGGPSAVPQYLIQLQEDGMKIFPASKDSPLKNLYDTRFIYGYTAALWTDESANIPRIHNYVKDNLKLAYLGCMVREQKIGGQMEFFDFIRPLQIPVAVTFKDGEVLANTNRINI